MKRLGQIIFSLNGCDQLMFYFRNSYVRRLLWYITKVISCPAVHCELVGKKPFSEGTVPKEMSMVNQY
jgi:hypothetical protein